MKKLLLLLAILTSAICLRAQQNSLEFKNQILSSEYIDKQDIKNEFIKHDISHILTQTSNAQVFGFIGDNYQRIRIKLISVIKNKHNPSQYFVYGKSMVKENVCEFQGTITITNVFNSKDPETAGIKNGKVVGEYLFLENPSQKHVGQFKGVFSSDWYIDKDGSLKYNDLNDVADGFSNNEFVGTWTSYSGTLTKICNWGDGRIPMSGDLDVGTGEFVPSQKYAVNGWTSYLDAFGGGNKAKTEEGRKMEQAEWWN
jgi:hypothetical protein